MQKEHTIIEGLYVQIEGVEFEEFAFMTCSRSFNPGQHILPLLRHDGREAHCGTACVKQYQDNRKEYLEWVSDTFLVEEKQLQQ